MSKRQQLTPEQIAQKEAARKARERAEMIEGARNYAKADRTDPFSFARSMAHIDLGLAAYNRAPGRDVVEVGGGKAFYTASPYREERTMVGHDGTTQSYGVIRYMNVARP